MWSNLSSYKQSPEKVFNFNGIRTHDLHDTGAMLYLLSYEALRKQVRCEFNLYPLYEENKFRLIYL